jgi:hypothetical protein
MFKQHSDEYSLGASENVLEISYAGSKMSSWENILGKYLVLTCSPGAHQRKLQLSKACSFYEVFAVDAPYRNADFVPAAFSCFKQHVLIDNRG